MIIFTFLLISMAFCCANQKKLDDNTVIVMVQGLARVKGEDGPLFAVAAKHGLFDACETLLNSSDARAGKVTEYGVQVLCDVLSYKVMKRKPIKLASYCHKPTNKNLDENYGKIIELIINHASFEPNQFAVRKAYYGANVYNGEYKTYPLDWVVERQGFEHVLSLLKRGSTDYCHTFLRNLAPHIHKIGSEACMILSKGKKDIFWKKIATHCMDHISELCNIDEDVLAENVVFLVNHSLLGIDELSRALFQTIKKSFLTSKFLLEYNASCDFSSKKEKGNLLMLYAKGKVSLEKELRDLIEEKKACDPKKLINGEGNTPFHYLYPGNKNYDREKMSFFHALGADLCKVNNNGDTPLHMYAKNSEQFYLHVEETCKQYIDTCISHGVDPCARNKDGHTASDLACGVVKNYLDRATTHVEKKEGDE